MRIAVCISGNVRNFQRNVYSLLENFIYFLREKHQVDIFLSTWDLQFSPNRQENGSIERVKDFIGLINPVSYVIDEYELFRKQFEIPEVKIDDPNRFEEIKKNERFYNYYSYLTKSFKEGSMWYKIFCANELKKKYSESENIKYDVCFRCRPDLVFLRKFELPQNIIEKNIIYSHQKMEPHKICDWFFWSTSETMDRICQLYSSFPLMRESGVLFKEPEEYLFYFVYLLGINSIVCPNIHINVQH